SLLLIGLSPARMNEKSAGRLGLLEQEGQHGAFVVKRMWAIGVDGLDGRAAAKGGPVGGRGCEACFGAASRPSTRLCKPRYRTILVTRAPSGGTCDPHGDILNTPIDRDPPLPPCPR